MKNNQQGYTMIIMGTFIFVFITGAVVLTSFVTSNIRAVQTLNERRVAGFLAQAGIEKAVFCLNHTVDANCGGTAGLNYSGEAGTALSTGTFDISVVDSGNDKIVHATGTTTGGNIRAIRTVIQQVSETTDISFVFGAQIGDDGINMGNNSVIVGAGGTFGNVHSNGNISCGTNGAISGTAIVSGSGNKIENCEVGYDGNGLIINDDADAWAHNIQGTNVAHDGNIPTGGSSNSSSYGLGANGGTLNNGIILPPPTTLPVTDQMITDWKAEAVMGSTINSDYTTSDGESIGPVKIEGDLTIPQNTSITLAGTIWVEGDILFENSAIVNLASAYGANSGVIVADDPLDQAGSGQIVLQNTVSVNGSGDPDSYIMLASTNTSGTAIDVGNSATNAIYVTTQGTIKLGNNADVKAVVAYGLDVGNNMTLTYESGLASSNFASGPGGVWAVKRETWQILK